MSELELAKRELRETRALLERERARFRSVFEGMGEGLLITDLHDRIEYANERMTEMCGFARDEMIGRLAYEVLLPRNEWPELHGRNERRAQGHSDVYETLLQHKSGKRFWALVHATPLRDANGQVVGTIGAQIDITERKCAELALRQSEERLRGVVEHAVDGFIVHDFEGRLLEVNAQMCESLDYAREELLSMNVRDFELRFQDDEVQQKWMGLKESKWATVNGCQKRRDGSTFLVEVRLGCVEWNGTEAVLALVRDVTERRAVEEQMRNSLREKEVLLKEVHHRVKNNLQIVNSLLSMQAEAIGDAGIKAAFAESQNRVRAMALIHETLYLAGDLGRVDVAAYCKRLTSALLRGYGESNPGVSLRLDVPCELFLPLDAAVPCGLIINELVTNSFKYAFPEGRSGAIFLSIARGEINNWTLYLSDDGVGTPDFDLATVSSTGLQLVTGLCEQLEADFRVDRAGGTRWTISFITP